MNTKISFLIAGLLVSAAFITGCRDEPDVASPACADLAKLADPVKKAELGKRCPRTGTDFKPSPERKW